MVEQTTSDGTAREVSERQRATAPDLRDGAEEGKPTASRTPRVQGRALPWLAAALAGLLLGVAIAFIRTPLYSATAQSFVSLAPESASESDPFGGSQFVLQRMDSYAALATSPQVLSAVVEQQDLPETMSELAGQVTSFPLPNTVLLNVTVRDPDPQRAAALADAVASAQADAIESLEGAGGPVTGSPVRVTPVQAAVAPPSAGLARVLRYAVAGISAGFVIFGCGVLVRRSARRTAVRGPLRSAPRSLRALLPRHGPNRTTAGSEAGRGQ